MEFDGMLCPKEGQAVIYIIPVSSECDEYRVIYPDTLEKKILQLLYHDDLIIKQFSRCTPEAAYAVKQKLKDLVRRRLEEYKARGLYMFFGGIGLAVLGILSWTFPDPLLLVDEIAFTVGGGILTFFGAKFRKQKLPLFREVAQVVEARVESFEEKDDPLLSRIFESIRAKEDPKGITGSDSAQIDQIDAESLWLVDYLNVREMVESQKVSTDDVANLLVSLQDVIPLRQIATLEKSGPYAKSKQRAKRKREHVADRYGLSDDAITVYCELYKSAKEFFESRGITL